MLSAPMVIFRPAILLFPILCLLLASCGTTGRTMDTGLMQKRRHLKGWDLEFLSRSQRSTRPVPANRNPVVKKDIGKNTAGSRLTETLVVSTSPGSHGPVASSGPVAMEAIRIPLLFTGSGPSEERTIEEPEAWSPQEDLMHKKRWNLLAIPSFLMALATVYLGLFGLSTINVVIAIILTLILSGISLRQIRSREQSGKGFAIAALLIALLALLYTAMVTAVVGFI
jgi:hypothetical protein